MDNFIIAFIIFLVFSFASRVINENGNKKLDQEKKAALIDLFSGSRIYSLGILICIVAFLAHAHIVFISSKSSASVSSDIDPING